MDSRLWSLSLPPPIFLGVLAAWMPVPPSVMVGLLFGAIVYALLNQLLGLREWAVDDEELVAV